MAGPAHRNVSNIRPGPGPSITGLSAPGSPHTPASRILSGSYGSPTTIRAEEECVVIEIGSRFVRVGLAGDGLPKATVPFNPTLQRRSGDYRQFQAGFDRDWRKRVRGPGWGDDYTLWEPDLRKVDLGLVGDKIERAVQESFTKYLLIDSKPRRMALALPTAVPLTLISTVMDTLFSNFQATSISIISSPMLTAVAAGLRAALVVDIGWAETTVTAIYEFREVSCRRSIRAARMMSFEVFKLLARAVDELVIPPSETQQIGVADFNKDDKLGKLLSFEETEDVMERIVWCKPMAVASTGMQSEETQGLSAVREENELETSMQAADLNDTNDNLITIPLRSSSPPTTIQIPFSDLAKPCEYALLGNCNENTKWDDEEMPLHELIYHSLLQLPLDIRSICMSRIIFTGGASNTPGLKMRLLSEVRKIIETRGWEPVIGKAVTRMKETQAKHKLRSRQANSGTTEVQNQESKETVGARTPSKAADEAQEADPIGSALQRDANKGTVPTVRAVLRAVDSMGAWSGASLLSQLKVPAVSVIERESWLQSGISGATRAGEVTVSRTRQSMGPAGLRAAEQASWTLGPFA